jgi:phage terminase small subunit
MTDALQIRQTALTSKQRAFVNAYLSNGFNAVQAAHTAGYALNTANELSQQELNAHDDNR